jgi:hypothetical protein
MQTLKRFKKDDRGVTAVIFSLALLPILGAAGAAVDYSRAINVRAALQKAVDAAALQAVSTRKHGQAFDAAGMFVGLYQNRVTPNAPQVEGGWSGPSSYTVSAQVTVPTTIFSIFQPTMEVRVTATAEAIWRFTRTEIEGFNMSPEAADYNELYAYCYKGDTKQRLGPIDPASLNADGPIRRLEFQKIADNSNAGVARRPASLSVICGTGEVASYHLRNIRGARLDTSRHGPEAVDHNRPCGETTSHSRFGETWRHYTDSTLRNDARPGELPQVNTCFGNLIETIVCHRREDCLTKAMGGSLPDFMPKDRTPQTASRACPADGFIYFGWEDRPPGIGQWTDRDYDDIRLTVRCPQDMTPTRGPARLTM